MVGNGSPKTGSTAVHADASAGAGSKLMGESHTWGYGCMHAYLYSRGESGSLYAPLPGSSSARLNMSMASWKRFSPNICRPRSIAALQFLGLEGAGSKCSHTW
eukprot:364615-Chlamydomonas_euryale.AAC.36